MFAQIKNSLTLRQVLYAMVTILYCLPMHSNQYIILKKHDSGFFSVFNIALSLLDDFDLKKCSGVTIDLGTGGLYYDRKMGPNWWNYYFQPIRVGHQSGNINDNPNCDAYGKRVMCSMARQRGNYLIQKYIKVKPYVQRLVDNFYNTNLTNAFLIGIHYRGTDKSAEATPVTYDQVYKTLQKKIASLKGATYKIFVATDDQNFLNFIKSKYSNIYYTDSARSSNGAPLHTAHNRSPFKQGLECLTDVLLLARCNTLIRTASNMTISVSMFNPNSEFISLSKHNFANCPRSS